MGLAGAFQRSKQQVPGQRKSNAQWICGSYDQADRQGDPDLTNLAKRSRNGSLTLHFGEFSAGVDKRENNADTNDVLIDYAAGSKEYRNPNKVNKWLRVWCIVTPRAE